MVRQSSDARWIKITSDSMGKRKRGRPRGFWRDDVMQGRELEDGDEKDRER